jgi:hypothetical protein
LIIWSKTSEPILPVSLVFDQIINIVFEWCDILSPGWMVLREGVNGENFC